MAEINGAPASLDDLRQLALTNYGHFTFMQVRGGRVRGLALHMERLDRSTRELFGRGLDPQKVLGYLRRLVPDRSPLSLRVNVFSRDAAGVHAGRAVEPDVLVTAGPPLEPSVAPLRVTSVRYERALPHVKHVGTFSSGWFGRTARQRGFDDALFAGADGRVSEGTIWNVCFFDGERVVWPEAPMLTGITMQLLQRSLARCGVGSVTMPVRLADLRSFRSAFAVNSISPAQPIASVDDVVFGVDAGVAALLGDCYERCELEPIAAS